MKHLKPFLILWLGLGLLVSCSDTNESPAPQNLEYRELLDVSYGANSEQVFDIYLPENRSTNTKVMILVHGGGWNAGDKSQMNDFKDYIRQVLPDVAVVNMNYRLADASNPPHPMQMNDITLVVDALEVNRDEYVIGSDIGFMGTSAGGHLSLLWSYAYDTSKKVTMVCSLVGPTNLADEAYINSENQALRDLIFQFGNDIEFLREVSPLFKANTTSPPTILFYGAQDPLIPNSQGIDLHARLNELNVINEFTLYPDGGHGWVGEDLFDTSVKLKAFIEEHL